MSNIKPPDDGAPNAQPSSIDVSTANTSTFPTEIEDKQAGDQTLIRAQNSPPATSNAIAFNRFLPFECLVSLRLLREGSTQTAFIIGGVAIGVAVIVFMSALLSGLQANFVRRALTGQAHIQLLPPKEIVRPQQTKVTNASVDVITQAPLQRLKSIDQWQSVASQVRLVAGVDVVSPAATGSALVIRGDASRAISVMGIEPEYFFKIVPMDEKSYVAVRD